MPTFLTYYGIGLVVTGALAAVHEDDEDSIFNVDFGWGEDVATALLMPLGWPVFAGYELLRLALRAVFDETRRRLHGDSPAALPPGEGVDRA